jgi:hypothetical protein
MSRRQKVAGRGSEFSSISTHPDEEFAGTIVMPPHCPGSSGDEDPIKVLVASEARSHRSRQMRPGMRFHGTVELARAKSAADSAQRGVCHRRAGGVSARPFSVTAMPLKLGRENEKTVKCSADSLRAISACWFRTGDKDSQSHEARGAARDIRRACRQWRSYRVRSKPSVSRARSLRRMAIYRRRPRPFRAADAPGNSDRLLVPDGSLLKKDEVWSFPSDRLRRNCRPDARITTAGNKMNKTNSEASTTRTNLRRDAHQASDELLAARQFKFDDAEIFRATSASNPNRRDPGRPEGARGRSRRARKLSAADAISFRSSSRPTQDPQRRTGAALAGDACPVRRHLVLQRDWRGHHACGDTAGRASDRRDPDLQSMKAEVFVLRSRRQDWPSAKALSSKESRARITGISQVDKLARPRLPRVRCGISAPPSPSITPIVADEQAPASAPCSTSRTAGRLFHPAPGHLREAGQGLVYRSTAKVQPVASRSDRHRQDAWW